MKSLPTLSAAVLLSALFFTTPIYPQGAQTAGPHRDFAALNFVENKGQWPQEVDFRTNFDGQNALFVEDGGYTYLLTHPADIGRAHEAHRKLPHLEDDPDFPIRHHAYRVRFVGGQPSAGEGVAKRKAYHNYLIGNDPAKWAGHVPLFGKVLQKNIYEGIHLETYSQLGRLKYDLLVQPGAFASQIKIQYLGTDRLELLDGNLNVHTSVGMLTEMAPVAWQELAGKRQPVACQYVLDGGVLSFHFPQGYDPTAELVIDPTVVAATLTGSDAANFGHTATFDNGGNIYAGGISFGPGYPTTTGAFQTNYAGGGTDIGISKYNPDGSDLIYATYIGGFGEDAPHSLITDANQQLYVYGSSNSSNYPVSANAVQPNIGGQMDIVVSILSPDGSTLVGSSFFGGNGMDAVNESNINTNYGDYYRGEIVLDNQNNVYVVSSTSSANFPVTANAFDTTKGQNQDAVAFKANSDLSVVYWATFLGANDFDIGNGIRVGSDNNVYLTGGAGANNFPTTLGTYQSAWPGGEENAFLVKLSADGSTLLASTFFGANNGDSHAYFLDVDEDDNVHIYGQSTATIPITPGTYSFTPGSNQFLAALTPALDAIVYSTVIGVPNSFAMYDFVPVAFMVDKCNGIYFSGYSAQPGLPTTPNAVDLSPYTFYLAKLTPSATALDFGTYYGDADHVDGGTSRFDKSGVVYQGVCSCSGGVMNTLPNAWATSQTQFCDIGVFKIDFDIETVNANGIALPSTSGCAPYSVDFEFTGTNAITYQWTINGAVVSSAQNHTYVFNDAGTYAVQLVVANPTACNPFDTLDLQIDVLDGESTLTDTLICGGDVLYLDATTANATYLWQDGSTAATFVADQPGTYWVDVSVGACARRDSFLLNATTGVTLDLGPDDAVCDVASILLDVTDPGIVSYLWQNGATSPTFTATANGTYSVQAVDTAGCTFSDEIELVFGTTPQINLGLDSILCDGGTMTVTPVFSAGNLTWQDGSTGPTFLVTAPGTYWAEADDDGCKARDSVEVDFLPPILPNEAGLDILCANDCNGVASATPQGGTGSSYLFLWNTGDTTPSVDSLCPGTFTVTITDAMGCTAEATAAVGAPPPLAMSLTIQDVECPGDSDGALEVSVFSGGTPPYLFAFGNSGFGEINGVGLLPGGVYEVVLQDANGCTLSQQAVIDEPDGFLISAGQDIEIELGESTRLNSQIVPDFGQTILWSPDDFLECDDCPDPALSPTNTTEYLLTVTDTASGCTQVDTVLVLVKKSRGVYIPNVFSPNGDGANDFFTLFSGIGVAQINELRIFDRWGEMVYEFYNFPPNDLTFGWDGMLQGKHMQPAVFTYFAFVEFKDGEVVFFEGDVTLVR